MFTYKKLTLSTVISLLTIFGALGGVIGIFFVHREYAHSVFEYVFLFIAFLYFSSGILLGVGLLFGRGRSRALCMWYWGVQIPMLNTGWLSFHAVTAVYFTIWLRFDIYDLGFAAGIASQFQISFFEGGVTSFGLNIMAVLITITLRNVGFEKR